MNTRENVEAIVLDVLSGGKEKTDHEWQQSVSEAEYCIENLCPTDGIVCDLFLGSGTTAVAATKLNRQWIGFEINPDTAKIASERINLTSPRQLADRTTWAAQNRKTTEGLCNDTPAAGKPV